MKKILASLLVGLVTFTAVADDELVILSPLLNLRALQTDLAAEGVARYDGDTNTLAQANAYADSLVTGSDVTVTEGEVDGAIQVVKGTTTNSVSVHGLGSAAYADTTDFDAAGTAADAIADLDTSSDVAVVSVTDGVVTFKTIAEEDGIVNNGTDSDVSLAKVATTGSAEDVSYDPTGTWLTSNTVKGAITQLSHTSGGAVQSVTESTENGKIQVVDEGVTTQVPIHGLGTAAFTASTDYDAAGAADAVQGDTDETVASVYVIATNAQTKANAAVVANNAITAGTHTKITYDSKGLVTAGEDLAASDIPALDASKITSGTFDDEYITSAATWNAKQDTIVAGTNVTIRADGKTIDVDVSSDIEAAIIKAMTTGITYGGHNYKLVVDLAD